MENLNVKEVMNNAPTTFPDHTVRLLIEYKELVERVDKLEVLLMKNDASRLTFVLNCPARLLVEQLGTMKEYADILRRRMLVYEGITLEELNAFMRG